MSLNRILAILAAVLFLLSALTYRNSVQRAERFERGQPFLANLNPDEIAEILIVKGEQTTHLERAPDEFVVTDAQGYPARNDAVNRFVRQVLEIGLDKRVGSGDDLQQELELVEAGGETIDVMFKAASETPMVHFLVGKAAKDGGGNYVRRVDTDPSEIFLTSSGVYLNTSQDDFLKKELVDVRQSDVQAIRGRDFVVEEQGGALQLTGLPSGKKENASKMAEVTSALSGLRFTKHYLADAAQLGGLNFDAALTVQLKDQSSYQVAVATEDDKHYLKIRGFHSVQEIAVNPDDSEEEVREKSEILARADEIRKFNAFHGSWVYEVSQSVADKIRLTKKDLIEDA